MDAMTALIFIGFIFVGIVIASPVAYKFGQISMITRKRRPVHQYRRDSFSAAVMEENSRWQN